MVRAYDVDGHPPSSKSRDFALELFPSRPLSWALKGTPCGILFEQRTDNTKVFYHGVTCYNGLVRLQFVDFFVPVEDISSGHGSKNQASTYAQAHDCRMDFVQ